MKRSIWIFLILVLYLVLVKLAIDFLDIQFAHPSQKESFSWIVIGVVGVLGIVGILASARTGFPGFWDSAIPIQQKLFLPLLAGLGVGVLAIGVEAVFELSEIIAAKMGTDSIHIPFPSSAMAYPAAAILVSVFQYLIPVPILVWLLSNVILRGKFQTWVFLIVGVLAALVEPISQTAILKDNPALLVSVFAFVLIANLIQLYLFRKSGFLAAIFFRLSFYLIWHVAGSVLV